MRYRRGNSRLLHIARTTWPFGRDGALVVGAGQTVILPSGSIKDYSSISIAATGTLQIGSTGAWTMLGCAGNCTINGQIRGNQNTQFGTFTATAPDGTSLSYSTVASNSGQGGDSGGVQVNSGRGASGGTGGSGGGGGYSDGFNGNSTTGGAGASGFDSVQNEFAGGAGGASSIFPSTSATNGSDGGNATSDPGDAYGAGGAGGAMGRNGSGLYLVVKGQCLGSGSISLNGEDGTSGGVGGQGNTTSGNGYGGGGGGGGAGGCGGKLQIKFYQSAPGWFKNLLGGNGGGNGGGGGGTTANGQGGNPGDVGVSGSYVYSSPFAWPNGGDGNLTVANGETYTLYTKTAYQFNNITVNAGGILGINAADPTFGQGWLVIGCRGNFQLDGTLSYGVHPNGTFTYTAPDGRLLSRVVSGGLGGAGGPSAVFGSSGGDGSQAGSGSDGNTGGGDDPAGGAGGTFAGGSGASGGDAFSDGTDAGGGGGGGGAGGNNAGGIYLRCLGNFTGSGTIDLSASDGGGGGQGGNADVVNDPDQIFTASGGSGGGGGGGGQGGDLVKKIKGTNSFSGTITVSGGSNGGGAGGGTGINEDGGPQNDGNTGTNGVNGTSGTITSISG